MQKLCAWKGFKVTDLTRFRVPGMPLRTEFSARMTLLHTSPLPPDTSHRSWLSTPTNSAVAWRHTPIRARSTFQCLSAAAVTTQRELNSTSGLRLTTSKIVHLRQRGDKVLALELAWCNPMSRSDGKMLRDPTMCDSPHLHSSLHKNLGTAALRCF